MKYKLLFLFICITTLAFPQQEASVWYFGRNAGLKFHTDGSVQALSDGQLNTLEGCSTIADSNGNLLFYTDGRTVYDRNHVIMPNGNYAGGTGLYGDPSSTQSGIIVPKPGDPTIYYIFTVDEPREENAAAYPNAYTGSYPDGQTVPETDDGYNRGLNYSVVDLSITGNNGSIGDIVLRNNHLVTYDINPFGQGIKYKCSEKITAVKNDGTGDYWVITHFIDRYYSFRVGSVGVVTTPVVSQIGPTITTGGYYQNALGYIKTAPNGEKLAVAHSDNATVIGGSPGNTGFVLLYDFNKITGQVSNEVTVRSALQPYGIEFSPSGKRLYATYRTTPTGISTLAQFDLESTNIPASEVVLASAYNMFAIQLAPNNKLYCAIPPAQTLGVINDPEILGLAANYNPIGQPLWPGRRVNLGLPPFITSFFNAAFTVQNLCLGASTNFTINATHNVTSALWDFGDGGTSADLSPTHQYLLPGTYTITLTATTPTETSTNTKEVTVYPMPVANPVPTQWLCGNAGAAVALSQFNAVVLGTQAATVFGISYFPSQSDADLNSNALPANYPFAVGTTMLFGRIYTLANPLCFVTTSFAVTLFKQPVTSSPLGYVICENLPYNNMEQFDLNLKTAEILNGQSATEFTVTYHSTQSDAENDLLPLPFLYTNSLPQETIYVRIENNLHPGCFAVTSFTLQVIRQPTVSAVTDFGVCDDISNDGIAAFDLSLKTTEILNGQSAATFEVKYYLSLLEAQNGTSPINVIILNSSNYQLVHAVISAIGNIGCKAFVTFRLVVSPFATATTPVDQFICDDSTNDGIGSFSLQDNDVSILGTQSASQFTVSYHLTANQAISGSNPLPAIFTNTANPQLLFARVQGNPNTDCFETTSFQVGLHKMPVIAALPDLVSCDDAMNDGIEPFHLTDQNAILLGSQSATEFTISYYSSQANADSKINPLSDFYTNTINPHVIYARIENTVSAGCYTTTEFLLTVRSKPIISMSDSYSMCEGNPITMHAPTGFSSYLWSDGSVGTSLHVITPGSYWVTVTTNYGDVICDATKNIVVFNSNVATITAIDTDDWTDANNVITVLDNCAGNCEYSLDGTNYQYSNQFYGLQSGLYTVFVKDKGECGIATQEVYLLMYPKYFTPNGDGIHEFWKIKFSETEPDMKVFVYDRYGKLITGYTSFDPGWDGMLNGESLPATDYWFVVQRQDGKMFRGHFSLLR